MELSRVSSCSIKNQPVREKASSTRNLNYHVNLANLAGSEFTCAAGGDDANDSCADGKLTDVSGVPVGSLGHVIRSEVFTHVRCGKNNGRKEKL